MKVIFYDKTCGDGPEQLEAGGFSWICVLGPWMTGVTLDASGKERRTNIARLATQQIPQFARHPSYVWAPEWLKLSSYYRSFLIAPQPNDDARAKLNAELYGSMSLDEVQVRTRPHADDASIAAMTRYYCVYCGKDMPKDATGNGRCDECG